MCLEQGRAEGEAEEVSKIKQDEGREEGKHASVQGVASKRFAYVLMLLRCVLISCPPAELPHPEDLLEY